MFYIIIFLKEIHSWNNHNQQIKKRIPSSLNIWLESLEEGKGSTIWDFAYIANMIEKLYSIPDEKLQNLSQNKFYLDTPLLIQLSGADGEDAVNIIIDIIEFIRSKKGHVRIFKHTEQELDSIIESSINSAKYTDYNRRLANPIARYLRSRRNEVQFIPEAWKKSFKKKLSATYGIEIDNENYSYANSPHDLTNLVELENFFWQGRDNRSKGSDITDLPPFIGPV